MLKTAAMFDSETRTVPEMDRNSLGTGEGQILRRVYGRVVEQGIGE